MFSADTTAHYERLIADLIDCVRGHVYTPEQADYGVVVPFVTAGMLRQMKALEIIAPHDDAAEEDRQLETRLVNDTLAILRGEKNDSGLPPRGKSPRSRKPNSDAPEASVEVRNPEAIVIPAAQQQKGPAMASPQQTYGYREVVNKLVASWLDLQRDSWTTRTQLEGHVTRPLRQRTLELSVVAPGTTPKEAISLVTMMLVEDGLRQLKERGGIKCRTGADGAEEFLFPSENSCLLTDNGPDTGAADEVTSADVVVDPDASPTDESPAIENAGEMPNRLIDQEVPAAVPNGDDAVQSPRPATATSLSPAVIIDPEFQSLIPPSTPEELKQLEENLCRDGICRDALKVWLEPNLLLDGHQRHQLCLKHGIPYRIETVELADREAAREWILTNQLGRRNLAPETTSYLRGKLYEAQKRQGRRNDLTSAQNEQKLTVAEQLGRQQGVSAATIRRDAQFATNLDTVAANCGAEVRQDILTGHSKLTRQQVEQIAQMPAAQQKEEISKAGESRKKPVKGARKPKRSPQAKDPAGASPNDAVECTQPCIAPASDFLKVKACLGRLADADALLAECTAEVTALGVAFDDQQKAEALATARRIIAGGQQILTILGESAVLGDDSATALATSEG